MKISADHANCVFKGEGYFDLPARVDREHGIVTTTWVPSFEERAALAAGRPLYVHLKTGGATIPAIMVDVAGVEYGDDQ